ncbi:hypothetical protein UGMREWDR_CDS0198 [Aeromonas phage GomatiRiver_11]|nr:hypothetical protein UGMREWDR_CDS0198 [Aeromonas phage GomatiRiver_11]
MKRSSAMRVRVCEAVASLILNRLSYGGWTGLSVNGEA